MRRDEASDSPAEAADDFLYHLYRGSELLLADQVHEAKGELEQALALQPQDAKGQDLLAGVYFRLGVYPRAIEIWQRLVTAYGKDATLKVNLALALIKTGQNDDALAHLTDAVGISPDHDKAWGYLGLTYWRMERFREARDAFLRGGQASMARRMEAVLHGDEPAPTPNDEVTEPSDRAAMRSAAEQAIEQFESEQLPLSVASADTRSRAGAWRVAEPGEPVLPRARTERAAVPNTAAPTLSMRLAQWTLAARDDAPLSIGPSGELFLSIAHDGYVRLDGLVAVRGELRMTPVRRRIRGRDVEAIIGAEEPIMRLLGPVAAVIAPEAPGRFYDLALSDDVLFLREDVVWGFDGRLGYESGVLPGQSSKDEAVPLLSLHGSGVVVLRLDGPPTGMAVDEDSEVAVEPRRLLGWSGRLLPKTRAPGTAPYGAAGPTLSFRGRGVVLVT